MPAAARTSPTITRATNNSILAQYLGANSSSAASQALLDGLNRLQDTVGDTADGTSPAAKIAALSSALQAYANAPSDASLGQAAVASAQSVASTLNSASQTVTAVRDDADAAMTNVGQQSQFPAGQVPGPQRDRRTRHDCRLRRHRRAR